MTTMKANHWSGVQEEVNGVEKITRGQGVEWIIHVDILITWNDGITGGEKDNSQPDAKVFTDVWETNRLQGGVIKENIMNEISPKVAEIIKFKRLNSDIIFSEKNAPTPLPLIVLNESLNVCMALCENFYCIIYQVVSIRLHLS